MKLPPINSIVGIVWEDSGLVNFRAGVPPDGLRLGLFRNFGRLIRIDKTNGMVVITNEEVIDPNTMEGTKSPDHDTYSTISIGSIKDVWILSRTGQKRKK